MLIRSRKCFTFKCLSCFEPGGCDVDAKCQNGKIPNFAYIHSSIIFSFKRIVALSGCLDE